jgi:hypothetical protein
MKLHIGANSMEERMSADPELKHPLQKNKIHCIAEEDGGDGDVEIYELWLWDICLSAQRTFDAQVIFIHSPHDYSMKLDEVIKFFVPRDHPRIADLEAYLIEILDRVRKACVAAMPVVDGWSAAVEACPATPRSTTSVELGAIGQLLMVRVALRVQHASNGLTRCTS